MTIIAIVGAGSLSWGRAIVLDLLLNPDLAGAEIRLHDIDPARLALAHEWLEHAQRVLGSSSRITAGTDLRTMLAGARHCITSISVGGDRMWRYDATYPQLDGIFQPVGDTVGPGGAVRALRHFPKLRAVAEALIAVGAPGATLLQVSNPLNVLTGALDRAYGDRLQVVGFCHGYWDTEGIIATQLGLEHRAVRVEVAGNNHFMFLNRLHVDGVVHDQGAIARLMPRIADNPLREVVFHRYGALVGNHIRHPAEFLPEVITRAHGFGTAWGIRPVAEEIDPLRGDRQDDSRAGLERMLAEVRRNPAAAQAWKLNHSREPLDAILAAIETGRRFDIHLNVMNRGAIAGVADDAHVELFCTIEGGRIHRQPVTFSPALTAEIARVGDEQARLAEVCLAYDEDRLLDALALDALMPPDRERSRRLMREMIAFQHDLIFPNP